MASEENKLKFKEFLKSFTAFFENGQPPKEAEKLSSEINLWGRDNTIDSWISFLRSQGPVEKVADGKYEIYDVNNFMDIYPHKYFEENNLHGFLIETVNDFDSTIEYIDEFLKAVLS